MVLIGILISVTPANVVQSVEKSSSPPEQSVSRYLRVAGSIENHGGVILQEKFRVGGVQIRHVGQENTANAQRRP
jgi:hypothetical protein